MPQPRKTPSGWVLSAPAKLNLYLQVHGKRPDGFHDLTTLIAPIRLADTLHLSPRPEGDDRVTLRVASALGLGGDASPDHRPVPADERNLVVRALLRLRDELGVRAGIDAVLVKRIPSLAGLGGGSSDAAAALRGGQLVWSRDLPPDRLMQLAADLGSDVPVFVRGAAAVCRGRGEQIQPTVVPAGLPVVLVQPKAGLGAGQVYQQLDAAEHKPSDEAVEPLVDALRSGRLREARHWMTNCLQPAAERLAKPLADLRRFFADHNVAAHQLTGSGAVYFALCYSARQARRLASLARGRGFGWAAATVTL